MARAVLPGQPDQPDLRGDQRDPAGRDRPRPSEAGIVLSRTRSPTRRLLALAAFLGLAIPLPGCDEEDRKAWVSILPGREEGGGEEEAPPFEGFGITADSSAVLLDGDTLLTVDRLPRRSPDGLPIRPARFATAILSPDTTRIAFTTRGRSEVVGVWSRPRQTVQMAAAFPEGEPRAIRWSPDGRYLAIEGVDGEGVVEMGVFDPATGSTRRHPVSDHLSRQRRSVRMEGWIDADRLRVLVSPGPEPRGGLAYVWVPRTGTFALESHFDPLGEQMPAGARLEPGGVFSLDLFGDPAPESVAIYRAESGVHEAIVLASREGGLRTSRTAPLIPGTSGDEESRLAIERVVTLDSEVVLVLRHLGPRGLSVVGLFQPASDGRLVPVEVATASGVGPAFFPEGRLGEGRVTEVGLVDLDGDGRVEVVRTVGSRDPTLPSPGVRYEPQVFRWESGLLVPAPDLEAAAREEIGRRAGRGG